MKKFPQKISNVTDAALSCTLDASCTDFGDHRSESGQDRIVKQVSFGPIKKCKTNSLSILFISGQSFPNQPDLNEFIVELIGSTPDAIPNLHASFTSESNLSKPIRCQRI